MYIRNIIGAIDELQDGEVLFLNFKSGKTSKILKDDEISMQSADLKVTRKIGSGRCIIFIDPSEIECLIIKRDLL